MTAAAEKNPASKSSNRDIVIATIKREHDALRAVVELLQDTLHTLAEQHTQADFGLLSSALYYIDEFPERCHHPKEDEFLFKTLRQRTAEFNTVLDQLQREHVRSAHATSELQRALVHYQAGAASGLARLKTEVDVYAALHGDHMKQEEALLAQASKYLTDADWRTIAAAFIMNDDPLLSGAAPEEFRKLHARIVKRTPRKLQAQNSAVRPPQPSRAESWVTST